MNVDKNHVACPDCDHLNAQGDRILHLEEENRQLQVKLAEKDAEIAKFEAFLDFIYEKGIIKHLADDNKNIKAEIERLNAALDKKPMGQLLKKNIVLEKKCDELTAKLARLANKIKNREDDDANEDKMRDIFLINGTSEFWNRWLKNKPLGASFWEEFRDFIKGKDAEIERLTKQLDSIMNCLSNTCTLCDNSFETDEECDDSNCRVAACWDLIEKKDAAPPVDEKPVPKLGHNTGTHIVDKTEKPAPNVEIAPNGIKVMHIKEKPAPAPSTPTEGATELRRTPREHRDARVMPPVPSTRRNNEGQGNVDGGTAGFRTCVYCNKPIRDDESDGGRSAHVECWRDHVFSIHRQLPVPKPFKIGDRVRLKKYPDHVHTITGHGYIVESTCSGRGYYYECGVILENQYERWEKVPEQPALELAFMETDKELDEMDQEPLHAPEQNDPKSEEK